MKQSKLTRRRALQTLAASGLLAGAPDILAAAQTAADSPRDLPVTAANLGNLFAEVERLARANRYGYSFLGDRFRTLDDFKKTAREKVFELLLYRPDKVAPAAKVIERMDRGDFFQEKILFSTASHFQVPAYVLIPKKAKTPAPAIVDLHSHGGMFLFGKEKVIDFDKHNHAVMVDYHKRNYDGRPTATALVRRGYVVITIDAFFFGERRLMLDADRKLGWDRAKYSRDDVQQLNLVCRGKENTLVKSLVFAGLTWPGIVFWDDIRTVDYLVTRPEVDPKRIGCLGISMGGYRSAYLAGLDERIAAACVVGFMSTVRPMIRAHVDTHSWVHFLPCLHQHLDLPDVVSMMAPKPLLVQQCRKDALFPPEGMRESVDKIGQVYAKAGAKGRFEGRYYDVPHQYTLAMQDEAFAWFDRHLKG